MRRKISRRERKRAIALGFDIICEKWIKEPQWRRKDVGYLIKGKYNQKEIMCAGYDELEAYRDLLSLIHDIDYEN